MAIDPAVLDLIRRDAQTEECIGAHYRTALTVIRGVMRRRSLTDAEKVGDVTQVLAMLAKVQNELDDGEAAR